MITLVRVKLLEEIGPHQLHKAPNSSRTASKGGTATACSALGCYHGFPFPCALSISLQGPRSIESDPIDP